MASLTGPALSPGHAELARRAPSGGLGGGLPPAPAGEHAREPTRPSSRGGRPSPLSGAPRGRAPPAAADRERGERLLRLALPDRHDRYRRGHGGRLTGCRGGRPFGPLQASSVRLPPPRRTAGDAASGT